MHSNAASYPLIFETTIEFCIIRSGCLGIVLTKKIISIKSSYLVRKSNNVPQQVLHSVLLWALSLLSMCDGGHGEEDVVRFGDQLGCARRCFLVMPVCCRSLSSGTKLGFTKETGAQVDMKDDIRFGHRRPGVVTQLGSLGNCP